MNLYGQMATFVQQTVSRAAVETKTCAECGCDWSYYGGCVNPDCDNYEGAEFIRQGDET